MTFNEHDIQDAVREINSQQIADIQKVFRKLVHLIDLTTLEATDTDERVRALCKRAWSVANEEKGIPTTAAVCVYPPFVKTAVEALQGKDISVAAVAGAFPSGQSPLEIRLSEVRYAVKQGAKEIDMVITRGRFLAGDEAWLREEVQKHKEACSNAHLKVILETGELKDPNLIYKASMISMEAGADFIKTSTGKVQPAATLEAAYVMLHAIREFYEKTGKKVGFKPAGGISEPLVAVHYYQLVDAILGQQWLNNELFRIGASRLLNQLEDAIA